MVSSRLPSHRLINCAFIIAVASWSLLSRILRKESVKKKIQIMAKLEATIKFPCTKKRTDIAPSSHSLAPQRGLFINQTLIFQSWYKEIYGRQWRGLLVRSWDWKGLLLKRIWNSVSLVIQRETYDCTLP